MPLAVGIGHGLARELGPRHLQRPPVEPRLDRERAPLADGLDRDRLAGPRVAEDVDERADVGRGGTGHADDHVAGGEAGLGGGRARTDDADPAALGHRLGGEVAEVSGAIVLIVELFAGELDSFDGGAAAGERDEHPRVVARAGRGRRLLVTWLLLRGPRRRQPRLQRLPGEDGRQRDGDEQDGAAFHDRLRDGRGRV